MKPGRGWDKRLARLSPHRRNAAVILHRVAKRRGLKPVTRQRRFIDRLPLYYGIYVAKGMGRLKALRRAIWLSR